MAQKYIGIIKYESGDYSSAAAALSLASTQFSADATVQLFRGILLFKEGRNSEALDVFRQALTNNPANEDLLFHAASLCMLGGFHEEAPMVSFGSQAGGSDIGCGIHRALDIVFGRWVWCHPVGHCQHCVELSVVVPDWQKGVVVPDAR